jgi:glycosyltransferase involved in cell wall biosynthesis
VSWVFVTAAAPPAEPIVPRGGVRMSHHGPLVSVITPVFNPGPLLAPAVESLLGQTLADFELIAVDDGSTDGSRESLQAYAAIDSRVRVILHPENHRTPTARNTGIAVARGEFLAFQNHDDRAEPVRLERQAEFLRRHPGHGAVASAVDFSDPEGRPVGRPAVPSPNPLDLRWTALTDNPFHPSGLMVRTALLHQNASLRFDPELPHRSDYGFHAQLLSITTVGVIPDVLVHYVLHADSISRRHAESMHRQSDRTAWLAIQRELPGHPLSLEQVAAMRAILLHLPGDFPRDLAATKQAWDHYWRLYDAFRLRHAITAPTAIPLPPNCVR